MNQPMQPLIVDSEGIVRFQKNAIVQYLLDHGGIDMNELAVTDFSQADRTQFAQLIGYSLDGFHQLPYVSDEDALLASAAAKKINPEYGACRDDGCEFHCGVAKEA